VNVWGKPGSQEKCLAKGVGKKKQKRGKELGRRVGERPLEEVSNRSHGKGAGFKRVQKKGSTEKIDQKN